MRIKEIRAAVVSMPRRQFKTRSRRPVWDEEAEVANPMSRYPRFKAHRKLWTPKWEQVACVVEAEDGTWGLGVTSYSGPVAAIINDHYAPLLKGEDATATEKLYDMMFRISSRYSSVGLPAYAASAVDLALWDLKGKLLNQPVYSLLGGPARERIFCYATGNDTDWYMELGFKATKLACPYGPADGLEALEKNEALVAKARELVGPHVELMLDCWMAFDLEFAVRLIERLRPYKLKWIEDYFIPEDFESFRMLRQREPAQGLATGEHWYTPLPFMHAAAGRWVDIFQPDIRWVGGITPCVKICHIAEAAGISVITHGGMNYPYGQHLAFAMPAIPWGECSGGVSAPGVPMAEAVQIPGTAVPKNGYLVPSDAPGFGIELTRAQLESWAV